MICIYHSRDLDGWCSAAIVKLWYSEQSYRTDKLTMIGWDYGQEIPTIPINEEVIMVDISFPVDKMKELLENNNLEWCDHHISAINDMNKAGLDPHGLRDTKLAACELTWKYLFLSNNIPKFVSLLGKYDSFRHKGTEEEKEVLEFQYGARQCISNYEEAYDYLVDNINQGDCVCVSIQIDGAAIYRYLCTEAKQVYKNGFPVFFNSGLNEVRNKRVFVCINRERFNPINFGIDYHKDGFDGVACFHYNGNNWQWSLYNDNGEVDCSVIAKMHGGGGHKGAAGFIQKELNFNF